MRHITSLSKHVPALYGVIQCLLARAEPIIQTGYSIPDFNTYEKLKRNVMLCMNTDYK